METSAPAAETKPSARAQPAPAPTLPLPCLAPALATAAILWACYHPLAWGWLGWVALVPLLCLVRSHAAPRRIYFSAWIGGCLFFLPALQWMRVADQRMVATWFLLAIYCALYFPAAIYLTRVLERRTRLPLVVTFSAVWVALEYARSFMLTGFAWYYLAHSQHECLALIQITDIGGVYAVSLLVAAVNALLFDALYQFRDVRAFFRVHEPPETQRTLADDWPALDNVFLGPWRRGTVFEICIVAALIVGAYLYGGWRLEQPPAPPGPILAMLQGNLDIRIRSQAEELPADREKAAKIQAERNINMALRMGSHYEALARLARFRCQPRPDLFIWPETSFPERWVEVAPELPIDKVPEEWQFHEERSRNIMREAFSRLDTPQLLGIPSFVLDVDKKERRYNSALLLNAKADPEARYDKMHRVPFGEYLPFREWRDWLPIIDWISPYEHDYSLSIGEKFTRFELNKHRFGVLVCYEDTDPFLARRYVSADSDGPPVDFLVNMSNEGWFDDSCEHEEHLAVCRFRSIECRRAMVRSVNMGISAIIDGNGRVLKADQANPAEELPVWTVHEIGSQLPLLPQAEWAKFKKVAGVLVAAVPIDDRFSFYAYAGDWLAGLCWLLIALGTVGVWLLRLVRPAPAI
jgi:apolipoprotein N-acyltransferase